MNCKNRTKMRYLIRVVKYFIWFVIILAIMLTILVVLGETEFDPLSMFRDGTKSLWQIAILFFVLALVYPLTGFRKKETIVPGEYPEARDIVIRHMESRGYKLESEEGETLKFRLNSKVGAFFKMFEDRITFEKEPGGFRVEGLRREVVRIISTLEQKIKTGEL